MSTMGVTVYCNRIQVNNNSNGDPEQLMLLRTLQDNESNILGNQAHLIVQKGLNSGANNNNNNNNINNNNSANNNTQNLLPSYDPSRLKKHGKNGQPPPVAVARRNARERNRVKQVNNGFATLRQHIPSHIAAGYGDRGKKLSKVETLRMAVEYIRGLQRLLAEADGTEYDSSSSSMGQNVPSPTSSIVSSSHNGSGERLAEDEANNEEDDRDNYHDDEDDESKRVSLVTRLSPNLGTNSTSPKDYYSHSTGDEENLEPGTIQQRLNLNQQYSRLSPTSLSSSQNDYYIQNEENLEPKLLSPFSAGGGDSEEGGTIYPTSPEAFSGALYYKQEIVTENGEFMDVVSWWEQEQGRIVHHTTQPHAQRLAHV